MMFDNAITKTGNLRKTSFTLDYRNSLKLVNRSIKDELSSIFIISYHYHSYVAKMNKGN